MNDDEMWKLLYVFRGNIPIAVISPFDAASQVTTGNPTAQVVNASGGTPPLVVLGGYWSSSAVVDPRTFSTTKDGEISTGDNLSYLAYKIYNSGPADTTIDMDDEGTNGLASCYIACS